MSIQKVRDYFSQWGIEDKVMELTESSAVSYTHLTLPTILLV